jgi:hypothetical protein
MNVPIGLVAFAIGLRHIPEEKCPPSREETFDRVGAFLFLGAFLALQVALSRGNDWGWLSAPTLGAFAGSAALGYLFLRQETSAHSPMLHLALFRSRLFSFSVGSALVHLGFLAAGMMASAGTLLTAARSEGNTSANPRSGKTMVMEGDVPEEVDPVRQAPT